MSGIVEQLLSQLDGIAAGATATVEADGDRLILGVSQSDALSLAFSELRLETDLLAGAQAERVREVAEKLTRRITYLLEPLTPIEIDHDLAVVQMRSTTPQRDRESSTYYELLVKTGGSLSLRRYRKPTGAIREPIDATLTREVLVRLVDDLLAAVVD